MTDSPEQQADKETQRYMQAYQQVWNIYQTNNDNYFRRTQILMFAIQVAVFAALIKLTGDIDESSISSLSNLKLASLWIISLFGLFSALAWATLIVRQWSVLELYRRYMRHLECVLMAEYGVPLAPFTLEKAVFTKEQKCILFDSRKNISKLKSWRMNIEHECFPDCGKRGLMKIKMMKIEEYMAVFLMLFWFSCFGTLPIYRFSEVLLYTSFIFIPILLWAIAFTFWILYSNCKKRLGHKRESTKKFSEFMNYG